MIVKNKWVPPAAERDWWLEDSRLYLAGARRGHCGPARGRDSIPGDAGGCPGLLPAGAAAGTGRSALEQGRSARKHRGKIGGKWNAHLVFKRCSDVGGRRALVIPSLSRAFLLCTRGRPSWLEAASKPMFDTVKTPDRVTLPNGRTQT